MAVKYDSDHALLTFGGYTTGGHEQWQCGLRWASDLDPVTGQGAWKAALEHISISDIYAAIRTMWTPGAVGARWDSSTSLEFAKLALVDEDGKYFADPIEHRAKAAGSVNAAYTTPPQLAVVVSLSSGTKIGHANHGRMFLPCPVDWVNNVDPASGMVVSANINALRASVKTMIEAVAGEISTVEVPTSLAIFSPVTPKSVHVTEPSHKTVTRIGIGATVDTQRSRRRSLGDGITTWSTVAT